MAGPLTVTLRHPVHVPVDAVTALLYLACAIGVALLTLRRPAFGAGALLVLSPFDVSRYLGPTTITTLKAGLVGLLVALLWRRISLVALRSLPARAVLLAFALLLAAMALSVVHAGDRGAVLRELLKWAEYLLLFGGALLAFASDPDESVIWRALEITVALVALSALAEYAIGAHSGMFIGGHFGGAYIPRIAGALEGPNQLAGFFDITLPLLIARLVVRRDAALIGTIVLAVLADLGTVSRSGFVAAAIGILAAVLLLRPGRRTLAVAGACIVFAAAAGLAVLLHNGVPHGYFSLDQETQSADHLGNRRELWSAAIALWRTSPLTGIGAGNYELDLGRVGLPDVHTHANSLYFQSLAEDGIIGLAATLAALGLTVFALTRAATMRTPLVAGMLAATIALAVHQLTDLLVFFPKVGSVYWLATGAAIAAISAVRRPVI